MAENNTFNQTVESLFKGAVLVIQNGTTKLVNIKNQDGITKVLDMVPDFVNRFTGKKEESNSANDAIVDEDAKKKAGDEMEEILSDAVSGKETDQKNA